MRPTRFAHLEGHTDICYTDNGNSVITCGVEGDIRIFKELDDDESITYNVAECVHCIAYHNSGIIAGTNLNIVQYYTLEEGKPNGIVTRCTAFPTHVVVSKDKKLIAVASSDMLIKVHDSEKFCDHTFSGHTAPVLSVALDPKGDFLASSSCDGSVCIWNLHTQTMVQSFPLIPKCNDINASATLCRLCWSMDGQYLFVPVKLEIMVFDRSSWQVLYSLNHSSITEPTSVAALSSCGDYLATGCYDGRIVVWNVKNKSFVVSEKSPKGMSITGLVWHPGRKNELSYVNRSGHFGTMENFLKQTSASAISENLQREESPTKQTATNEGTNLPLFDNEDEDDAEISLAKIKAQLGFADDEEGTFVGAPSSLLGERNDSRPSSRLETPIPSLPVVSPKLSDPQKPFQPGMSPKHFTERYMVWNNVGIVRQYQTEMEESIEVEFHDHTTHHALRLVNPLGYNMANLTNEALVLASESQNENLSKLQVHHFSSWDGNKEWHVDMTEDEDILAITNGIGWVAVATDSRILKIFSITGVQQHVLSLPGPVVCMAGFERNIMFAFHSGMGLYGEQSISMVVLNIDSQRHLVSTPSQLPLSPKSFLVWAGFTDEGTPMIVDSDGVVRLMNKSLGHSWIPILNTKLNTVGKSDNYFILGGSEIEGVVRGILCKGSRYPPLLPRPYISLLNFKIPLCDPESEKSVLEQKMLCSKLLSSTVDLLARDGFDMAHQKQKINASLKESMVKLFALACHADREARAVDICKLMHSPEIVEIAIKYASKIQRLHLAEKLNKVIEQKVEEKYAIENEMYFEDERPPTFNSRKEQQESDDLNYSNYSSKDQISQDTKESKNDNALLALSLKQKSHKSTLPENRVNPFKKTHALTSVHGLQRFDSLKPLTKKEDSIPKLKPVVKKPRVKQDNFSSSSTLQSEKENKMDNQVNVPEVSAPTPPASNKPVALKKTSALKLWLEDNRERLKEKYAAASEKELLVKAARMFEEVEDIVKQKYKLMAASLSQVDSVEKPQTKTLPDEDRKRKADLESVETVEKKIRTSQSKLSGFVFAKQKGGL